MAFLRPIMVPARGAGPRPWGGSSATAAPSRWRCSMQVKVYAVGRKSNKEAWAEVPVEEYRKRLSPVLDLQCEYLKDDAALLRMMEKVPERHCTIAMDEGGRTFDSEGFSSFLMDEMQKSGGRIQFFVGGADGLPPAAKSEADVLISLSRMTFTHKIARLVLIEQIYRAMEIYRGSKYNK